MKQELVDQLIKEAFNEKHETSDYGFTRSEVENLITSVVDRCIVVMENEMDRAMKAGDGTLYASLVDIAFNVMDDFGIDELGELPEDELVRVIESWASKNEQ